MVPPSPRSIPTRVGTTSPRTPGAPRSTVHPHACGDNWRSVLTSLSPSGPSPRVWGQLLSVLGESVRERSIPTRVGTTWMRITRQKMSTVHPHACGDNVEAPPPPATSSGPSPRVWGQRQMVAGLGVHRGPSPRVWGQPPQTGLPSCSTTVHPHACGDNHGEEVHLSALPSVHPHACGENEVVDHRYRDHLGPSPRVWGQHEEAGVLNGSRRSIPTRVGTTSVVAVTTSVKTVHPHACGDNLDANYSAEDEYGPSPRVWGQRRSPSTAGNVERSIPTRVGTTTGGCRPSVRSPVHPHACGDNPTLCGEPRDSPQHLVRHRLSKSQVRRTPPTLRTPRP